METIKEEGSDQGEHDNIQSNAIDSIPDYTGNNHDQRSETLMYKTRPDSTPKKQLQFDQS